MKIKIKEAYLLVLIVTGLMFTAIYSTYALFTKEVTLNNVVSFNTTISLSDSNLIEYELVTLNPNESKKIELRINNSSSSTLYYGCWYELLTSNASISIGQDASTLVNGVITTTGTISTTENKTIVIGITNNGSSTVLVNLGVVGNTTSNLGLSSGRNIITDSWQDAIIVDDAYLNDHTTSTTETTNDEYTEAKMTQITLKAGTYLLQAWGAQGGNYSTYLGGKGGYSKGTITLTEDTTAFVYVGGQPATVSTDRTVVAGGFNGGGNGYNRSYSSTYTYGQGGGGASDIRIGTDSLYARVIVAGGGGGSASADGSAKYGGGTTGGSAQSGYGASQTSAGTNGSFGQGGSATTSGSNYKYGSGGGGGGWYGGGASSSYSDSTNYQSYNGGGSGYVYTAGTASNCPSGCLLNSNYYLTDAATYGGNTSFTDFNGSTVTGRSGNGAVKITGSKTTTSVSIPTISGLSNLNVALGSSVSLEKDVTYSCESTSTNCTYLGPDLKDTSSLELGTHTIYYVIKSSDNKTYKYTRTINVTEGLVVTSSMLEQNKYDKIETVSLEYTTPGMTELTLNSGSYILETWGARGGSTSFVTGGNGGKGGYSKGTLTLTANATNIYIYVGGKGSDAYTDDSDDGNSYHYDSVRSGGFNGGGNGYAYFSSSGSSTLNAGGGGASDIRIGTDSLYARVIVAGGGGGAGHYYYGGTGGGTTGGDGSNSSDSAFTRSDPGYGGTQTSGGKTYNNGRELTDQSYGFLADFGTGGGYNADSESTGYRVGGGGGWYGGGFSFAAGGGGGSGYIYTSSTASNYPGECLLNSSYYLIDASMESGTNNGDGKVTITGPRKTGVLYKIPRVYNLSNETILKGTSVDLTSGVGYECENGGTSCTYLGPSITDTSTLDVGTHTIYYKIKSANNELYLYPKTIIVKDKFLPNSPDLVQGLIPVVYNESISKWVKADSTNTNDSWYDYDNKKWANAVLVTSTNRSTYQNANAGTTIADADILAFYVWIPRFKYKVWNINKDFGTDSYNAETTGIDILFEEGRDSTGSISCTYNFNIETADGSLIDLSTNNTETCIGSNGKYYTHPAFTFGNQELNGFWMGKFELGDSSTSYGGGSAVLSPKIIPNIKSWRGNYLAIFHYVIQNMQKANNEYGLSTSRANTDSHMITNMEWGAVSYLTNSKYGRCTNGSCVSVSRNGYGTTTTTSNRKTVIADAMTGCGPISSGNTGYSTTCNAYNTVLGQTASTTGNIYGVYDMNGGAVEYTMSNISNSSTEFSFNMDRGDNGNVHYTYNADTAKYVTAYANISNNYSYYYRASRLGDAMGEVSKTTSTSTGWYTSTFPTSSSYGSYFARGGALFDWTYANIFDASVKDGSNDDSYSTRAILAGLS